MIDERDQESPQEKKKRGPYRKRPQKSVVRSEAQITYTQSPERKEALRQAGFRYRAYLKENNLPYPTAGKGRIKGIRGKQGAKTLVAARKVARALAEKAITKLEARRELPSGTQIAAEQYVNEGRVDKSILGNIILMEAAEVVLARFPDDHDRYPGQHIYPTRDRMAAMSLLAPYILEKPEQRVTTTVQTVESVLLDLARDEPETIEHVGDGRAG